MKRVLITFSGAAYDKTTAEIVRRGSALVHDVSIYDDKWLLDTEFYRLNNWLWSYPHIGHDPRAHRGFGWFCWKSFILMTALSRVDDGDIVMYLDADTFPIADFSVLYDICDRDGGIMLFAAQGCKHENWCKRDCFIVMGMDEDRYRFTQAGVARFMLFQKGGWRVQQFLSEWLTYSINPLATTFEPSVIKPEYPELHEHRCEQAIMTNLAHRYGLKLYREACQFGDGALAQGVDADLYPTLFRQVGGPGERTLVGSAYRNVPARTN